MKANTAPYKGARDFFPEDKRFQKWMFAKWRETVERYGYVEYDAPILEPTDLFLIKGNQEIINSQTYTFQDRGERSVTIRTEMTPSISRMVASKRQELPYPLRWYSIPNLWRYERMQRGRLREFWQLNVDMFGVSSETAELEMLQIVDDLFQAFEAPRNSYTIKLNSRLLINEMLKKSGLKDEQIIEVIRLIDKKNKMSENDFAQALNEISAEKTTTSSVLSLLSVDSLEALPKSLQDLPSIQTLRKLMADCKSLGIQNVVFDITLMRGFDYYTDIVFEAFDTVTENNRAILGGGRYDGLVGQFGVEPLPTIGFAVGDVVFRDFLESHQLIPKLVSENELLVLVRDEEALQGALKVARELRELGINTAVDLTGRKLEKQMKAADKSGVAFVLFVGQDELKIEKFTLKNLKTGKEEKHSTERIARFLKDSRS